MEYRTVLSGDTASFTSESGKPYLEIYEYAVDKKGRKILKKTDKIDNVYEKIQSFEESTDINNIMARFALGDETVLNVNKGYYIDTTNLPTNIFEVYEKGLAAEQVFNGMPADLKELFDNSPSSFFLADEKEFAMKVDKYNSKFKDTSFDDPTIKNDEVVYNG